MVTLMICAECHASNQDSETCLKCGASPLLLGRFRLIEQVGAGASGTTYRAERLEDGRLVAVKEMLMRRADSLKALELFEREAKILERLEHPGIPAYVEDFVHEAGRSTAFYLVQDFVEGKPLSERMRHPNTTEEVLKICDEVLEILTYLHSFNPPIIHRDVKPENIIERPDGSLALVDFGSVRAAIDSATGGSTVAGTFGFMAPEQLLGRALPQTDVYAVGALAVALLTGKSPDHFTQNDRSIDLSALKLPDGIRQSLLKLLNPAEQSRPDATEARLILRNTPTSSMVVNSPVSVSSTKAEVDEREDGLALKSAKETLAALKGMEGAVREAHSDAKGSARRNLVTFLIVFEFLGIAGVLIGALLGNPWVALGSVCSILIGGTGLFLIPRSSSAVDLISPNDLTAHIERTQAQIVELEKQQELRSLQDSNASPHPETLIGPATLKEAFGAYLEMPTPRPIPKSMAPYLGLPAVAIFVLRVGLPFLIVFATLFTSKVPGVLPWIVTLAIVMTPAIASFWYALQASKQRRLILSEGVRETATITSIQTDDTFANTTVYYKYRGVKTGSAQFKTVKLITQELIRAEAFPDQLRSGQLFGVNVGDDAHVLVHPSDPNLSQLMLVVPPKFDTQQTLLQTEANPSEERMIVDELAEFSEINQTLDNKG